jgi:hypothetical protein
MNTNKKTTIALSTATDAFKFAAFLVEGLSYIDMWTPTRVNQGGCGAFALLLTEQLDKVGIPYEIYALAGRDSGDEEVRNNTIQYLNSGRNKIDDPRKEKIGVGHVCVKIFGLFYDSDGVINTLVEMERFKDPITRDQLQNLYDNATWNEIFDRECVPFMKEKFDEIFSSYEKFKPASDFFKRPGEKDVTYSKNTIRELKKLRERSFIGGLAQALMASHGGD